MKTQAVVLFVSTLALSHGFILDILNKITGKSFQCTDSSGFKDPLIGKNITLILAFLIKKTKLLFRYNILCVCSLYANQGEP